MTTTEQPRWGHLAERCGGGPRPRRLLALDSVAHIDDLGRGGRKLAAEVSPEHFHLERSGQFGGS